MGSPTMKMIEKSYGKDFAEALRTQLANVVLEKDSAKMGKFADGAYKWIVRSAATTMFLNIRSAIFQVISGPNFLVDAVTDYGVGIQYMKYATQPLSKRMKSDLSEIVESGEMMNRIEQSNDPDMRDLARNRDKTKISDILDRVLDKGYGPTRFSDSNITVAYAGAPLYAALKDKYTAEYSTSMSQEQAETKGKEEAMRDFWKAVNESQQSALQMYRSLEQNSPWSRLFLTYGSVSVLYTRKMIRAASDMKRGRVSLANGLGQMAYYGMVQNIMFLPMQQGIIWANAGIMGLMFGDDEDDEKNKAAALGQSATLINKSTNAVLRGLGVYGAITATVKDLGMDWFMARAEKSDREAVKAAYEQLEKVNPKRDRARRTILTTVGDAAPTIGTKLRQLDNISKWKERKTSRTPLEENWNAVEKIVTLPEATLNIPTKRLVKFVDALFDVANEDLTTIESVARLTELLSRYEMEQMLPSKTPTQTALSESKKETSDQKAAEMEVFQGIISKASKDKFIQKASEVRNALDEAGKHDEKKAFIKKYNSDTFYNDLMEAHNIGFLREKDEALAAAIITTEGKGKSFKDADMAAAAYHDDISKAGISPEHLSLIENATSESYRENFEEGFIKAQQIYIELQSKKK
jgi:hypothetical protein